MTTANTDPTEHQHTDAGSSPDSAVSPVTDQSSLVSVIIPAYQVNEYIAETLDSVLAQTYENYEIVVVNDGCPDTEGLDRAIEPYLDRIKYIKQQNTGASGARNTGIVNANGKILAFLDADDIWFPQYLSSQVSQLESRELDLIYSDALLFGHPTFEGRLNSEKAPSEGEVNFDSLLSYKCCPTLSGTIVRKAAVDAVGGFAPELRRAMDYDLWLRLAYNGTKMGYQRDVLLKYRVRLDGISGNNIKRVEREIELFRRFKRIFDLNEEQLAEVNFRLTKLDSDLDLELGKAFLLEKDFGKAVEKLSNSNRFRRSLYLTFVIFCIKLFPRPFLFLYKLLRKDELGFVKLDDGTSSQRVQDVG